MSFFIYLISTIFMASAQIESPDAYLMRGKQSAADLQNVMLDIQINLPSLSTKDSFRTYFALMPKIVELAEVHRLESIYPGAVEQLGKQMVSYGIRWLDLSVDSPAVVQEHLRWIDSITAGQYIYVVSDLMFRKKDIDSKFLSSNIDLFISASVKKFSSESYIEKGYRDLNSETALKELKKIRSLDDQNFLFWVGKVSNQESLSSFIYELLERVYLIGPMDREQLGFVLYACQVLKETLLSQRIPSSIRIYDSLGEVIVEALDRATVYSWPLDFEQIKDVTLVLGVSQSLNLANRLTTSMYQSFPEMDEQNMLIAEILINQLYGDGAPQKAEEFANIFYANAPAVIRTVQKKEGIYVVKSSDGSRVNWTVHFFRIGMEHFVFALNNKRTKDPILTFYSRSYDYLTDTFVFHQTSPNGQSSTDQFIRAKFNNLGQLTVSIPNAKDGWTDLLAEKVQGYSTASFYAGTGEESVPAQLEGTSGIEGQTNRISVSIVESNGMYLAQMYDSSEKEIIYMEGFFSYSDGHLYLTSNKNAKGHITNMKVKLNGFGEWAGSLLKTSGIDLQPVVLKPKGI